MCANSRVRFKRQIGLTLSNAFAKRGGFGIANVIDKLGFERMVGTAPMFREEPPAYPPAHSNPSDVRQGTNTACTAATRPNFGRSSLGALAPKAAGRSVNH